MTVSCRVSIHVAIIFAVLNTTIINATIIIIAGQRPGRVLYKTWISNNNFIWINFQEWRTECVDLWCCNLVVDEDALRIPVHFEYLLRLRSDPFDRIKEVVHAVFLIILQDLRHLLLWNEPTEVSNPVVRQIFSAMVSNNFPHVLPLLSLLVPKFYNFFLFLISRQDRPGKNRVHEAWNCCRFQFLSKTFSSFARNRIYTTRNNGGLSRSLIGLLLGLIVILRRWLRLYFINFISLCNFARALLIADLSWSTHVTQLRVNFLPHGLGSVTSIKCIECLNTS